MTPSAMPACTRGGLSAGQLVVELPLQPPVEVDARGVLGGERGDGRACGVVQLDGPPVPVVAVLLGQRAPGGEVVEALPLPLPVRRRTPAHGLPNAAPGRRSSVPPA